MSPDGKTLYAADTEGARLWAFDIEAPGVLRKPAPHAHHSGRVICGLPGNARFDSLAVLANGNICVATLNTGYITEISPAGDIVRAVKMPDIYPTNICFGGADMCDRLHHAVGPGTAGEDALADTGPQVELLLSVRFET